MPGRDLIDGDLRRFIRGPVSALLGTADAMHVPDATRVSGLVAVDGRTIRALVATDATTARDNAAASGALVSLLVTDITSYRSIQWKGRVVSWHERTPGDIAVMHRHVETFVQACPSVGIDPVLAGSAIFPSDVVAVVIAVDEVFDQTPGPGAGRRLEAAG